MPVHPDADRHGELPIKLGPVSNGEFVPLPMSPVVEETIRRTRADAQRIATRLGMSRRRFLSSICGSALTLMVLNACSDEERSAPASTTTAAPGTASPGTTVPPTTAGGAFELPPESTTEPAAALEVLAGDEFVFDVQAHLLDFDLAPEMAWDGSPFFGQSFPQASCGLDDPRACFSIEAFLDLFLLQSDTSMLVLSAIPVFGPDGPLTNDVMSMTRMIAQVLCEEDRILAQGQAAPSLGALDDSLDAMSELRATHELAAWKTYTHSPRELAWFLDDHDPTGALVGQAFVDRVREIGPPIIAVHKGFGGRPGSRGHRFASPVDVGPAAVANPDIAFVVYHSGYEASVTEGPYEPASPGGGIDRLVASVAAAGLGPGSNVYAELGSTWRSVMSRPDEAAHVLGKLLVAFGEDNVVWGTDSIWYGSPQDQIEAFRAFRITDAFQEAYGYPALTEEVKAKILGGNSARLYGVEPFDPASCAFTRGDVAAARDEIASAPVSLG